MKRKNVVEFEEKCSEGGMILFRRMCKVVGFPIMIFGSILEARMIRPISNRGKARPYFSLKVCDVSGKNETAAVFFPTGDKNSDEIAFPEPDEIIVLLGHYNPKFRNILVMTWEFIPDTFRVSGSVMADDPWNMSYVDAIEQYLGNHSHGNQDVSDLISQLEAPSHGTA